MPDVRRGDTEKIITQACYKRCINVVLHYLLVNRTTVKTEFSLILSPVYLAALRPLLSVKPAPLPLTSNAPTWFSNVNHVWNNVIPILNAKLFQIH